MTWVAGQVVIVTGGASGIGRAIVERFLRERAAGVVVLDNARARLDAIAAELPGVVCVEGDVTRLADNQRAVAAAIERFGRLDTWIGNAGIFDFSTALADIPEERIEASFDEVFGINVKGYLLGIKAALPALVRSRGSIVLTLSPAASLAGAGGILYTASKHAGVGIVRQLAYELAPHVRVNAVSPGGTATALRGPRALDMEGHAVSAFLPPPEIAKHATPLGRFAAPAEHTGAYILLASREEGATMTGAVLAADGGARIRGITQPSAGGDLPARYDSE